MLSGMICCGVDEIEFIQDAQPLPDLLRSIYETWYGSKGDGNDGAGILVFTAVVKGEGWTKFYKRGDQLAAYIEKNKLGSVVRSKPKVNPNSSNTVRAYLWSVSASGFHKWAKAQKWYEKFVKSFEPSSYSSYW